ncbi:MAG: hypothetical protein EBX44_12790 [Betaproteobacteria bacterium]|nr:hypothetical protein [Betaproteobacteria bacterium]NDG82655.1 hypothetical protein [Betaproteobacteria bacterium]
MKHSKFINILMFGIITHFLVGPSIAQTKSSVELQAIQTRTYEYNERGTMRAVLAVLQNNKFENIRSDANAGLITAELPAKMAGDTQEEQVAKAATGMVLGAIIPFGGLLAPDQRTGTRTRTLSATVEEIGKDRTSVRILLKETERIVQTGFLGSTKEELKENDMTNQPGVYQRIFQEIDKEIFLRQNR